jgi:hypothetical protein
MNISQTLYKISNLRYRIRKKEVERTTAVNTGDQHKTDLNNADLVLLKEDLVVTVKAFNSIPAHSSNNRVKSLMAKLFQFRTTFNRK